MPRFAVRVEQVRIYEVEADDAEHAKEAVDLDDADLPIASIRSIERTSIVAEPLDEPGDRDVTSPTYGPDADFEGPSADPTLPPPRLL